MVGWVKSFLGGREVLMKAVDQAILTYAMSIFELPSDFNQSIQSAIISYW